MTLTDTLAGAFMLVLRLASPFLVYGLDFQPRDRHGQQAWRRRFPVYFITIPFILAGGLILLYFGSQDLLQAVPRRFEPLFMGLI
jgi:flagellar biosynthetic protein FliR